jgi:hypothetical protein
MDRKVVGVLFSGMAAMVAVVTSPQLLDVVWCSAVVVVGVEGSLEVKLPTIWTDEKQRWEESERREEYKREK